MPNGYQNKQLSDIKNDVREEFENKTDKMFERDDKEIYQAGMNIVKKYKDIMKTEEVSEELMKKMDTLYKSFSEKYDTLNEREWVSSDENIQLIDEIAVQINDQEDEIIETLKQQEEQKKLNEATKAFKDHAEYFSVDGTKITLTDKVNRPKIHEVLGNIKDFQEYSYVIDYINCDDTRIRNKMEKAIGGSQCLITYDANAGTYNLSTYDPSTRKMTPISQRALVWKGVTLVRSDIKAIEANQNMRLQEKAKQEQVQASLKLGKVGNLNNLDKRRQSIVELIPDNLKEKLQDVDGGKGLKDFLEKTEDRLDEIITYAKKYGYELHADPIGAVRGDDVMKIKLIDGTAETEMHIGREEKLGEGLYDLLEGEEDDYKVFLAKRLEQKRDEYSVLTKRENILSNREQGEEGILSPEMKVGLSHNLGIMKKFLENMKKSEGDSWRSNNDKHLVAMIHLIENGNYSLTTNSNISEKEVRQKILLPLQEHRYKMYPIMKKRGGEESSFEDPRAIKIEGLLNKDTEKTIEIVRKMSEVSTVYDKTESSFLKDEIIASGKLELENKNVNAVFKNINTQLTIGEKESKEDIKRKKDLIDSLYKCDIQGSLAQVLVDNKLLPSGWENNKDVLASCKKLVKNLQDRKKQLESREFDEGGMKQQLEEEKLALEAKTDKTPDEINRLNVLYVLTDPENKDLVSAYLSETFDQVKKTQLYIGVGGLIQSSLASHFVELGDGAKKGEIGKIINDIEGYGRGLSDKEAKMYGDIGVEVAIMVATSVLTAGAGSTAVAGALTLARMGASGLRMAKVAKTIANIIRITKTSWSSLNKLGKTVRMATTVSGLLVEAPVFNSVHKVINGIAKNNLGNALDDINLNPASKENIHTAAFLGALQVGSVLAQGGGKLMFRGGREVGKQFKVDFYRGLVKAKNTYPQFTKMLAEGGSMGTEFVTMMAAEKAMNLTFGYEVMENGKLVTKRGRGEMSRESITTTIGMIIGMRLVKPSIRHKLEQKMIDGNAQIIRNMDNPHNPYLKVDGKTWSLKDYIKGIFKKNTSEIKKETKNTDAEKKGSEGEKKQPERTKEGNETENKNTSRIPAKTTKNKYRSAKPAERARGNGEKPLKKLKELQENNLKLQEKITKELETARAEYIKEEAKLQKNRKSLDTSKKAPNLSILTNKIHNAKSILDGLKLKKARIEKNKRQRNDYFAKGLEKLTQGKSNNTVEIDGVKCEISKNADGTMHITPKEQQELKLSSLNDLAKRKGAEISADGKIATIDGWQYEISRKNDGSLKYDKDGKIILKSPQKRSGSKKGSGSMDFSSFTKMRELGAHITENALLKEYIAGEKEFLAEKAKKHQSEVEKVQQEIEQQEKIITDLESQVPAAKARKSELNRRSAQGREDRANLKKRKEQIETLEKKLQKTKDLHEKYTNKITQAEGRDASQSMSRASEKLQTATETGGKERREIQNQYKDNYDNARKMLQGEKMKDEYLTDAMKKIRDTEWKDLTKKDIEAVQKELGFTEGNGLDGILGTNTQKKMGEYILNKTKTKENKSFDFSELPEGYTQEQFLDKILEYENKGVLKEGDNATISISSNGEYQYWKVNKNSNGDYVIQRGIASNKPHATIKAWAPENIVSRDIVHRGSKKQISYDTNREAKEGKKNLLNTKVTQKDGKFFDENGGALNGEREIKIVKESGAEEIYKGNFMQGKLIHGEGVIMLNGREHIRTRYHNNTKSRGKMNEHGELIGEGRRMIDMTAEKGEGHRAKLSGEFRNNQLWDGIVENGMRGEVHTRSIIKNGKIIGKESGKFEKGKLVKGTRIDEGVTYNGEFIEGMLHNGDAIRPVGDLLVAKTHIENGIMKFTEVGMLNAEGKLEGTGKRTYNRGDNKVSIQKGEFINGEFIEGSVTDKIDGKTIRQYSWKEGQLGKVIDSTNKAQSTEEVHKNTDKDIEIIDGVDGSEADYEVEIVDGELKLVDKTKKKQPVEQEEFIDVNEREKEQERNNQEIDRGLYDAEQAVVFDELWNDDVRDNDLDW